MAGWTDSSAAASGTGGGGWRFTSHSTGGGGGGNNNRWRERGRGRPPPQAHYRYRPANSNSNSNSNSNARPSSPTPPHHHSGPAMGTHRGQGASSTSTRRSQPPRLPLTDKSPIPAASAIMPPADAMQPDDKANRNAANFECNVCFDMAADPVVTKCGHLFCWECLYQWLHVHSHHRECPVCKGQVGDDAIIPIYGRGGSAASLHTAPPRPTGARVESYRQQQAAEPDLPTDDDEDDPFDLQEIRLGFGVGSLRDAMPMMALMPGHEVDMEQHYYHGYTNAYDYDDDFGDLLGFPVFASASAGAGSGSSQGLGVGDDLMEALFNSDIDTHHPPALGTNHQNRGRHCRRQRARAGAGAGAEAADHSSTDGMVMGGSGAFYRNTGAFPNVTRGGSSRLYGGWTERGGRSNRNSRDAARPRIASRRQRTNYD